METKFSFPALIEKQVVKKSNIVADKVTLQLSQNGSVLFDGLTENLDLSTSFRKLSNEFHYSYIGKKVKSFDKYNDIVLKLEFNGNVYTVTKKAKTNSKGEHIAPSSKSIGTLLKDMYKMFAADILIAWQEKTGNYIQFGNAANSIAAVSNLPVFKTTTKK